MSFQFNISPPTKLKAVVETKKVEKDETPILYFAPFTPNPKICFDNIKVGTTESRLLILKNPSGHKIEVELLKPPPPDRNVNISFDNVIILPENEVVVELVWRPLCEGAWRDTVTFIIGRLKKDVIISYKSVLDKKTETKTTKRKNMPRVVSKKVKTPPKANNKPLKLSKFSPQKKIALLSRNQQRTYTSNSVADFSAKIFINDKENHKPIHKSHPLDNSNFVSPSKIDFNRSIDSDIKSSRNTYTVRQNNQHIPQIKYENFDDSLKENNKEDPIAQNKIYLKDLSNMVQTPIHSPVNSLQNKLNSSMFQLTPVQAYKDIRVSLELHPSMCSTNRKSIHIEEKIETEIVPKRGLRLSAFNFDFSFTDDKENTDKIPIGTENQFSNDFYMKNNISTETYTTRRNSDTFIKENVAYNKSNISTATYTKGSPNKRTISGETYVKDNLITSETYVKNTTNETYLKANISTETCGDIHNISTSTRLGEEPLSGNFPFSISPMHQLNLSGDGVKKILEANLWCKEKATRLDFISEETHLPTTSSSESENDSPRKGLKRKSNVHLYITPPKKTCGPTNNWNRSRYRRSSILDKSKAVIASAPKEYDIKNPFIIAATTSIDPFLNRTHSDPEWIDTQEENFVKCLNLLLTPPDELKANEILPDVGKLWQESKQKDLSFAPSKQQVTKKLFFTGLLNKLRKTALSLYRSGEIKDVIEKVGTIVDSNKLSIRKDKNPHLNVSLQSEIMKLFLSYNPFWLQIGLEVVFGTTIELHPKSLITGLHHFLTEKFFKNSFLLRKYKTPQCEKYTLEIKKIILKKFLYLVYFLDVAKNRKIIFYDPCLFSKKAQIKESREILLNFSKELLHAVGDVTRYLKPFGYVLTYKQTYIHEYEYAVKELCSDLRDGVRLTRIVELILLRNDLTNELRAPAISRLQKVHNVRVAFEALNASGFEIKGDIVPTDIVDAHREKTLSLLWQIIYKFQGPRYKQAAVTIQNWWRSLEVQIKLRILTKRRETYENAAITIQRWYKRHKLSEVILRQLVPIAKRINEEKKMNIAAQRIQSYLQMRVQRAKYLKIRALIVSLQSNCRKYLIQRKVEKRKWAIIKLQSMCRVLVAKNTFLRIKGAAIIIQQTFRGYQDMKQARNYFLKLRQACITIQRRFRATKSMRIARNSYVNLKKVTIFVQRRYRANIAMKNQKCNYNKLKLATLIIQKKFVAYKIMKHQRKHYQQLRKASMLIQRKFRANKLMKDERKYYISLKTAVILVQRRFRANVTMKIHKLEYNSLKSAANTIQRRYRAIKAMKQARGNYIRLRTTAIFVQGKYRANQAAKAHRTQYLELKRSVIFIQKKIRANREMKKQRDQYCLLKSAAVTVQRFYRTTKTRKNYVQLQKATILVQQKFRANVAMKMQRKYYLELKKTVVYIQNKFRANRASKIARNDFQSLRSATMTIQRRYRALKLMQHTRKRYLDLQKATLYVQRLYRAKKHAEEVRNNFQKLRKATVTIQRKYRALKLMRKDRNYYLAIHRATILLQKKYKANQIMKTTKINYHRLRNSAITIQRQYRALKLMKSTRDHYLQLKKSTVFIQRKYRANKAMKIAKNDFQNLLKASIKIQQKYRALQLMKKCRRNYLKLRQVTICLQQRYKNYMTMKIERNNFQRLRQAVVVVQRRFRAQILMKSTRRNYIKLQNATKTVQRRYKAQKSMQRVKQSYQNLRQATLTIQRRYRGLCMMKIARNYYLELKEKTIFIQKLYRANKAMKSTKNDFQILKSATISIQRRYRALRLMRHSRNNYQVLKKAATVIQRQFRAYKAKEIARKDFLNLRHSTIVMQRRYRALKLMTAEKNKYQLLKQATSIIQSRFRANRAMKIAENNFKSLRKATIIMQRRYRAAKLMKENRCDYVNLKRAAIFIQRKFRANKLMEIAKINYQHLRQASITIQRKYRALQSMKKTRHDYLQLQNATLLVQRKFRATRAMKIARTNFQLVRKCTIAIQRRYRALKLQKEAQKNYQKIYQASLVIQQKYRATKAMRIERDYYIKLRTLTIVIQRQYRAKKIKAEYCKLKSATILIQNKFRRYLIMKNTRQQFLQKRNAAIVIQRRFRANALMKRDRIIYLNFRQKVTVLQVKIRAKRAMLQDRNNYNKLRNATVCIQRWYRSITLMRTQKNEYILLKKYAIFIQRKYRALIEMKRERRGYLLLKNAAIIIQSRFRAKQRMVIDRTRFLDLKKNALKIQRVVRQKKIERKKIQTIINLQRCIKGYLVRKKFKKELISWRQEREKQIKEYNAAIKIQASWRGYFERKRSSSEINNIYNRLEEATNKAHPEKTLGHRREQCLHLLIQDNPSMGQIIRALTDLDFITRRCRDTCTKLSKLLPENLFRMIVSAIRSLPDMKASVLSTSILINFCKYPPTKKASWVPEYIERTLQVMLHWCDKEEPLFPHLCTLLWLFAQNEDYRLCQRKQKMWERSSLKGISLFSVYKNLPTPLTTPDWGLDYVDHPRIFNNSVHALDCLIKQLRLKIK